MRDGIPLLSTRTQARAAGGRDAGIMLWSDDQRDEPPEEMRRAQAMLRRAMLLVALAAAVVMAVSAWRS